MKKFGTVPILLFVLALTIPVFASPLKLQLTGTGITNTFVQEQVENILENLYGVKPQIDPLPSFSLLPYQNKQLFTRIKFPNTEATSLRLLLSSEKAPTFRNALLLFSDHPEILHENGLLFSAGLIFLRPVRLNYYHQNGSGEPPRAVVIRVDNKSDEPALIHILEARSGPSRDDMSTGHQASLWFLERHQQNLGRIETIPPNDYLVISRQVAQPGELVTGFIELEELKGHPLQIGVFSEDPANLAHNRSFLLDSNDTHARGAYEMSNLSINTGYTVGDSPKIIPLGDLPLSNLLQGEPLKGAYGMLWEGNLYLSNPFPTAAKVPIYFQPRGGVATATFVLNGLYKEIPVTKPYENPILIELSLPPQSEQKLHFLTMPEGGSSYPVRLIIGRMENI